jgi:hypothetical protein
MSGHRWLLIPIITEHENDDAFLEKIKGAGKLVLAFIVDAQRIGDEKTKSVGEKIKSVESVMDDIRKKFPETVSVKQIIEWGDWVEKLDNAARMEQVDEVILKNSVFSHELALKLKEKNFNVTII